MLRESVGGLLCVKWGDSGLSARTPRLIKFSKGVRQRGSAGLEPGWPILRVGFMSGSLYLWLWA